MKLFDTLGLLCVLLLLVLVPIHYIVSDAGYIYYRELLSGTAGACAVLLMLMGRRLGPRGRRIALYVFASIAFVVAISAIDSGRKLDASSDVGETSTQLSEGGVNQTLYVIRMFVLYVPTFLFLALVRLSPFRFRVLCWTIAIMGPVAILKFLDFYNIATIATLATVLNLEGSGLQYNSFVPHLTFSVIVSLYLFFETRRWTWKLVSAGLAVSVVTYAFVSTSRQASLFCLGAMLMYYYASKESHRRVRNYLVAAVILGAIGAISIAFSSGAVGEKLASQTSVSGYGDTTGRLSGAWSALTDLTFGQWILGAGLTSVINSGPHNDFIRWIQRIGLPGMLLVELPFVAALLGSYRMLRRSRSALTGLAFLGVAFTLFHSFFGYPRDDAYQMLYSWVGLGLYVQLGDRTLSGQMNPPAAKHSRIA